MLDLLAFMIAFVLMGGFVLFIYYGIIRKKDKH